MEIINHKDEKGHKPSSPLQVLFSFYNTFSVNCCDYSVSACCQFPDSLRFHLLSKVNGSLSTKQHMLTVRVYVLSVFFLEHILSHACTLAYLTARTKSRRGKRSSTFWLSYLENISRSINHIYKNIKQTSAHRTLLSFACLHIEGSELKEELWHCQEKYKAVF